jgi:hypothetical protein
VVVPAAVVAVVVAAVVAVVVAAEAQAKELAADHTLPAKKTATAATATNAGTAKARLSR